MIGNTYTDAYIRESDFASKINELDRSALFSERTLGRCAHVILAPAALITTALDTIMFLGAGVGAICTLGTKKSFVDKMFVHCEETAKILVEPYLQLLTAINPPDPDYWRHGGLFYKLTQPLYGSTRTLTLSQNFLKRHVASRLTIALLAVSMIITKVIDLAIGIIAAPVSLLMLGRIGFINTLAINGLTGTSIVSDIVILSLALLNPKSVFIG